MRYPIIMNGDHAEFELEHANTPPKERPDWPLPSFDALEWAEAFREKGFIVHKEGKPLDDQDGFMLGWFANALMRGFDERASRASEPSPE